MSSQRKKIKRKSKKKRSLKKMKSCLKKRIQRKNNPK